MVVDKEKMGRVFACSKELRFDLLRLIHKVKYIGLKEHWIYIIKEQSNKRIIKRIYELKRLFRITVKVSNSNNQIENKG